MQAVIFKRFGGLEELVIEAIEKPKLKNKELLVRVDCAGLNPKDVLIRKGKFKKLTGTKFPKQVGFDFAGTIEEVNGNQQYKVGNRVFGMLNGWSGRCCAEYVAVHEQELFLMPAHISFEEAASIPLAAQTALQALRNLGGLKSGQTVCINGASGGVGTLAIQLATILGAKVTAITSTKNIDFCKSLGADIIWDYTQKNILETKEQFDVFFDVFGNYSMKQVAGMLTNNGRYITTVPNKAIFIEQFFNLFRKKKAKLVIVQSNSTDLSYLGKQLEEGKLKAVVEQVYDMKDIQAAQQQIETKRTKGKIVIKI